MEAEVDRGEAWRLQLAGAGTRPVRDVTRGSACVGRRPADADHVASMRAARRFRLSAAVGCGTLRPRHRYRTGQWSAEQATGIVAVLGVSMVVYYFLMGRRVRHRQSRIRQWALARRRRLRRYRGWHFEGVVAVLAMSELASGGGARTGSFNGGALLGIVAAVGLVARRWWPGRLGYELLYGVLGLAASVPALDAPICCIGLRRRVDPSVRILAIVIWRWCRVGC